MDIIAIKDRTVFSDGRVRTEYLLSSPVTREVLAVISKGEHIFSGYQYLSPVFLISKPGCISISGIIDSPIITVDSLPGMSTGIEDYLSGFLSTIADSKIPDSPFERIYRWIRQTPLKRKFKLS